MKDENESNVNNANNIEPRPTPQSHPPVDPPICSEVSVKLSFYLNFD